MVRCIINYYIFIVMRSYNSVKHKLLFDLKDNLEINLFRREE